ncbi:hypothetical protein QEJ31_13255 [Pigmentibacter sp. JX0631]|uniref:hypothetical protein n=1 Tax=Pigmentibacter sp. JX0631 TaxID=2976982 RepID=UPI002468ECB4|nr:hypothetical protein [Pigmentibacter sp. JX0631]WGL59491.1 hypothetical protein QEJ31_13255 [Pigmentibacter sp. JX0631]
MVFTSVAVSLEWNRNNLILRRGASQILINAEHVQSLRTQESEDSFINFFRTTALQNREARRVFLSWERKDSELLNKIYKEMMS